MDKRQQFLPIVVTIAMFLVWMQVAPVLFPGFFPNPKAKPPVANPAAQQEDELTAEQKPADAAEAKSETPLPQFPEQTIVLGEPGFDAGYLIKAEISTNGAAIAAVWLTDPRYTTLDRTEQLKVVGNEIHRNVGSGEDPETFDTRVAYIDKLLAPHKVTLSTVNWDVVKKDVDSVTLRYPSPDGKFEVLKTYRVSKADLKTRDSVAAGYQVGIELELKNLSEQPVQTTFSVVGPVGVPLENVENSRLFREIKLGTIADARYPNSVTAASMLANDLVKQYRNSQEPGGKPVSLWSAPVHYAGVDDQFFAALILPKGQRPADAENQQRNIDSIAVTRPLLLHLNEAKPERSDMTIVMESPTLTIPAKGDVTEEFSAYFGPKRTQLMRELNADSIIQLGWFAFVAKFMLWILGAFHNMGLPYAFAIILLTVVVRSAMFPISRKQAIEAEKMRILAPKMKEMQEKYKGQPEEFARAYREFQRKYNYHPLVGCLPALLQLPIFLGLYNALYYAVDLRLAKFLWVDNLAAPDQLFPLGFTVPFMGWTDFNLLPILTVILFVIQQKLFMPPAQTEEQAMQFRMMNIMMIAVGFAFYQVPAGLCVYFISSSLWGVCERLLLKKSLATHQQAVAEAGADTAADGTVIEVPKAAPPKSAVSKLKAPGWWQRALSAADEAKGITDNSNSERKYSNKDKKNKGRR